MRTRDSGTRLSADGYYRGTCVHCGQFGVTAGRGLITPCWRRLEALGRLEDYPRLTRSADEVLDEWRELADRPLPGTTRQEIAARMGMTWQALDQVLYRARRCGDARAIYLPHPRTGVRHIPDRAATVNPIKAREARAVRAATARRRYRPDMRQHDTKER